MLRYISIKAEGIKCYCLMLGIWLLLLYEYNFVFTIIWMFKYFALALDYFFAISFQLTAPEFSICVLIPPILHTFAFFVTPHCYVMHCKPTRAYDHKIDRQYTIFDTPQKLSQPLLSSSPSPTPFDPSSDIKPTQPQSTTKKKGAQPQHEYQQCKQCGLRKWVRMHHCYYCNVCVHKYDHHCVLLGICIGQANHKYYLPFLWAFLYSCLLQAWTYYGLVGEYIWIDEKGYQHMEWGFIFMNFAIIFFVVGVVIVGYLAVYHTYLGLRNNTTYEMRKRPEIYYFKGIIKDHPFDKGILQNIRQLATASANRPIQWQRPSKPIILGFSGSKQNQDNIFQPIQSKQNQQRKQNKVEYHYINLNPIKL